MGALPRPERLLARAGLGGDPLYGAYEDTLRRLLGHGFADLDAAERQAAVEQVVSVSALTASALAAAPLPFLDLPVHLAMVRAIAKVHGQERPGRAVLLHIAATLGSGLALRQLLRVVPFAGSMSYASRAYAATWALGRAANLYFGRQPPPSSEQLQAEFRRTAAEKAGASPIPAEADALARRLSVLQHLHERGLITDDEYAARRRALLERV